MRPLADAIKAGVLILAVSCSGVGFVWKRAEDALYASIRSELLGLARTAAVVVDADLHATLRAPEQAGSPAHLRALAPLVAFHRVNEDVIYVYTAILHAGRVHFILGTDYLYDAPYDDLAEVPSDPIMHEYTGRNGEFRRALEQQVATVNERPVPSSHRSYLSAYAPIRAADGRFEGVVGIDMWSRKLEERLWSIRSGALGGVAGVMLLSLAGGWAVYRSRERVAESERQRLLVADEAIAARERAEASAAEAQALAAELAVHQNELERLVQERTEEWRASEARFRAIVEQSVIGVFIADSRGMSYANPGMAAILGYASPAELLDAGGMRGFRVVSNRAIDAPADVESPAGLAADVSLLEVPRRDGSIVRLELHTQRIHPERTDQRIAIAIDVTERERAEAARGAALAAAEHLSQLKSQFIANASHELRTPLNGIIGNAHLGERATDLERAHTLFARILESARRLLGIVEPLLDFSALEKGTLDIHQETVELAALLDPLAQDNRERAAARGLDFVEERDPALPARLVLDRARVRQVLDILLSNAFKFTESGAVALLARREEGQLVLAVRDTGIGIEPAYIERLFVPLEQLDGSAIRRHGGTGLGLALANVLAGRMGGRLHIRSVLGEGSEVELRLPLVEAGA